MYKFFNKIWSFIWSPAFYQNLDGVPILPAVKRLIMFVFVGSFIFSIWTAILIVPQIFDIGHKAEQYVYAKFPKDLVLTIENGKAITSVNKVYEFKALDFFKYFSPKITEKEVQQIGPENLIVINTADKETTLTDWKSANAFMLITRDFIVNLDRGNFKISRFDNLKDKFVLNRDMAISLSSKFLEVLRIILPFVGVLMFLLFVILKISFYLIISLISACIIFLASNIRRESRKNFRSAFEIALYALCLPAFILIILPLSFKIEFVIAILAVMFIWLFNSWAETREVIISQDNHPEVK